jgi:hypothetical protein
MIHFLAFCVLMGPAYWLAERGNTGERKWPVWCVMLFGHITIELSWLFADTVKAALQ